MAFGQQLLVYVPTLILGVLFVGGALTLSIVGLLIVRRYIPHHRLKLHNDVAGPIFGTIGVVYAVLLAFAVVVVWQSFEKSDLNVEKEANCLEDLYRDAESFAPEFKAQVRKEVKEYAQIVVSDEWKSIARGEKSIRVDVVINQLWKLYAGYLPKNSAEEAFYEESIRKINELGELRTTRVLDARTGIHPVLWFVLILGGLITIAFTFFFGAENITAQMVMAILLALLISLILFTVLLLDFPFSGAVSIGPDAFKEFLRY